MSCTFILLEYIKILHITQYDIIIINNVIYDDNIILCNVVYDFIVYDIIVKGFVTELAPLHVQNVWGFREERIQAARLTACCNISQKNIVYDIIIINYHHK